MGKVLEAIDDKIADWIMKQKIFFVSSAPLSGEGHINCSPKGLDSFRILSPNRVAYLDLTGSGIETVAHLRENGRILIMLCAFEGPPQIVRLYGKGTYHLPETESFNEIRAQFPEHSGTRSIIDIQVHRVSTACGFSVPKYEFIEDRDVLDKWCDSKTSEQIADYRAKNNAVSIDGLPGLSDLA